MGIYTYPSGVVSRLQAKGPASFDVSVYFTQVIQAAAGVNLDGTVNIGNASGDDIGFYVGVGATQGNQIPDINTTATSCPWIMATENVAIMQSVLDQLKAVGLVD